MSLIKTQLLDGFHDIVQRAMSGGFRRDTSKNFRAPAATEFLDGGHVHEAVVQECGDAWEISVDEALVHMDSVAGQDGGFFGHMELQEGQDLTFGLNFSDGGYKREMSKVFNVIIT